MDVEGRDKMDGWMEKVGLCMCGGHVIKFPISLEHFCGNATKPILNFLTISLGDGNHCHL